MAAQMRNVDMLMVGKTGNGKSALGNMILQKPKAFKSRNEVESVTKEIQFDYSQFEDTVIKIVDGPGVGDTMKDKVKAVQLVVDAMTRAVMTSTEGFHAILIVVRYGGRFTEEDVKTIKILKDIFGDNFITNHSILVITCGDLFMIDAEENDDETFDHWCQRQGGIFSELLKEVRNRAILFNNKARGEDRFEQIRRLLHMIEGLSGSGARYTSKIFSEARLSRDRLVVESKRPLLQENTIREAGVITQLLGRVDLSNPEKELGRLNLLKTRADNLLQSVIEQDKGTKSLSTAISVADNLVKTLTGQVEQVKRAVKLQREEEELQRKMREEEEKRVLEEKRRQEEDRKRKEEEKKKKEEEKKRRCEEEVRRKEEERQRREEDERRQKELQEIKDAQQRLEALRLEDERREKQRQEEERREAERREKERKREEKRKREEERRQEQRRLEEEERQLEEERLEKERRRQEEELEAIKREKARVEKEAQEQARRKQEEIDENYKKMKEEENKSLFAKAADLGKRVAGWVKNFFS